MKDLKENISKRINIKQLIMSVALFEVAMLIFYNYFHLFASGWHDQAARIVIIVLMSLFPFTVYIAYRCEAFRFDQILIISVYCIFIVGVIFLIFQPYVISTGVYELYAIEKIKVINPVFSLDWLFYIFVIFSAFPRFKHYKLKIFLILFSPIILWILIRFIYL